MQIGTEGSAYGPGQVMSRPTLGRAVSPLPRGGDVVGTAVNRVYGGARPVSFDPGVLHRALGQALQLRGRARQLQGGADVPVPQPGAVVGIPEMPLNWQTPHAPGTPAFTVNPGALLARARLAQLLGSGS